MSFDKMRNSVVESCDSESSAGSSPRSRTANSAGTQGRSPMRR